MDPQYDAGKFLLATKLLHFALVSGLLLFGLIALIISFKQLSFTPALDNPLVWIAGLGCIGSIVVALLMFPVYRRITPAPDNVRSALQHYQAFCLMRWAVIEGGALFSAIVFIITKNILPLGLFIASVILLICFYPSRKQFITVTKR